jgi:MEMO1 family protein
VIVPPADARPRLRRVDVQSAVRDGQAVFHLRDPLQVSDLSVAVPQILGPLLALLDGTRTPDDARAALALQHGLKVGADLVDRLVDALDQALLLDNDRARRAQAEALAAYRSAEARGPVLAGAVYPPDPAALAAQLDGYLEQATGAFGTVSVTAEGGGGGAGGDGDIRGVISPHIDYARGWATYARVWRWAAAAARAADLVVLLGTDHNGRHGALTPTRQSYRTPYGTLPTARDVVDVLAEAIGEDEAFAGELYHRAEHSVELSAVWLHHMRGGRPVDLVPLLCGSFGRFVAGAPGPGGDAGLERSVAALRGAIAGRRALVVASADLSHVGPAFAGQPLDDAAVRALIGSDGNLLAPALAGDAEGYVDAVRAIGDRTNVCGTPPIYLLLRLLAPATGEVVAYDLCPADGEGTSAVSVCGVLVR